VRPEHPDHPGLNTATGVGVYGANISNNGGVGVEGDAGNNAFGVAAIAAGTGIGLFASANTSYGIWAYGQYPLYVQGTTQVGNPIAAFIAPGGGVEVNDIGNLYVTGFVYTDGSCQMGCSRTRHVASFAARTSSPTIDDVGEGALRAGSAHVMIERAFANAIDPNKTYVVLLTPEAPTTYTSRTARRIASTCESRTAAARRLGSRTASSPSPTAPATNGSRSTRWRRRPRAADRSQSQLLRSALLGGERGGNGDAVAIRRFVIDRLLGRAALRKRILADRAAVAVYDP
jgi:hypothetical protein